MLTPYLVLLAGLSAVVGAIWDISWHRSIGRDTFWTPAHMAIYLGGVLAGLSCGWHVLRLTFRGTPEEQASGVRFWGFRGPLGAWVAIWGAIAMITSAPFDDWWHNAYGLDVKVLSPPHALVALGFTTIQLGALFLAAARQNRAPAVDSGSTSGGVPWLVAASAGILITNFTLTGFEYIVFPNDMHNARFYLVSSGLYPIMLVTTARASRLPFPATAAAAVFMLINMLMIWILQLFPATPKLAPIYNPVTTMVPPPFPVLLVAPALAIDLVMQRARGMNDWLKALAAGAVFLGVHLAVQWPFSAFLVSPDSENFIFGAQRWGYDQRVGPWSHEFWAVGNNPVTAASLGFSLLLAAASARLGLWAGGGLSRVRR
jgi:hypothetical protein